MLKISVKDPPERGRANEAVQELLASVLGVPAMDVSIVSGLTAPNKTVQVNGLTTEECRSRLERLL